MEEIMLRRSFPLLLTLLWLFFPPAPSVYAVEPDNSERVLSFHSDITVHPDATMTVAETITVYCAGQQIKRGIYRDFPTRYKDSYGQTYKVDFYVQEVLRDGEPEDFHTEDLKNGVRIYMGRQNVFLTPGSYTYRITYATNRQLGFFKDFDELYWNVTGNGWTLPIEKASAVVCLPEGAAENLREVDAYTGYTGAKEKNFTSSTADFGTIIFETTRSLAPEQGLTIVVSWPKGFVAEPSITVKARYWMNDNRGTLAGLGGLCILFLYYLLVWSRHGKDPPRGTIIPLFEPPNKLSPAAIRFISNMGFDQKVFTAAVINMAVKGYLSIHEGNGQYTLKKIGTKEDDLSREEKAAAAKLFTKSTEMISTEGEDNGLAIHKALVDLQLSLKNTLNRTYFSTNRKYFVIGLVISFILLIGSSALGPSATAPLAIFMSVWLSGWTFGVVILLIQVFSLWKEVLSGENHRAVLRKKAVTLTLFSTPFVFFELVGIAIVVFAASLAIILIMAAMVFINLLFYRLMRARTPIGRKLMDGIEGFRMYLATAERNRLNLLNPPDRTPELFEKYLPYALALDVEQQWSEQFSDILAQASRTDAGYTPRWYEGTAWRDAIPSHFTSGLGKSLSSAAETAVASSSSSPGSSSGGGGGGSSGGGGGGGGGGGW